MESTQKTTFEQTPENLAAEEAAFDLATGATDQEPVVTETTAEAEPVEAGAAAEPVQEPEQAAEEVAPQAEPPPEQQPVKEPTIADLLAVIEEQKTEQQKLRDRVFGKVGELQQRIDAVKPVASGLSPRAAERLKVEFPELHEMLFGEAGTEDVTVPLPAAQPAVPVHTPALVTAEDATRLVEQRLIKHFHPDFEQVVTSPEFETWKGSVLKPSDAEALDDSWDASFVSAKIAEFKAWKAGETKKADDERIRKERLDNATTVRGIPRTSTSSLGDDDEEAAMLANYKPR